jgi:BirA family transcriptional regulator, biotin operon repressor / biotin---[acetyl-CoA-carboxylase] ligase
LASLNPIGTPFIELHTIESTNNYAIRLVREGMAHHGTAVFAHQQTKGKGQRNRVWNSEGQNNIAISIVIEPHFMAGSPMFLLSMTAAVAAFNFFNNYAAEDVRIKWPNDIYWRDRKAAGILIENVWQGGEWKYAVAGIGININQTHFGELQDKAVSLKQITGKDFVPSALGVELCMELEKSFQMVIKDPDQIRSYYRSHLYKLDQPVRLKKENRVFEAIVKGVSPEGQLIVHTATEERFDVGEVEWMRSR